MFPEESKATNISRKTFFSDQSWNVKLLVDFLKIGQREPFLPDIFPTGEHTRHVGKRGMFFGIWLTN